MIQKQLKNRHVFRRFGDAYKCLFDREHFMGRSAFEDTWLSPTKKKSIQMIPEAPIKIIRPKTLTINFI